jgi:hypothetical protein
VVIGNCDISGNLVVDGTITSNGTTSDIRDKKDILPIPIGLNFVNKLNPVKFTWNMRDGSKVDTPEFGFIAQELQEAQITTNTVYPNLVYDKNPDQLRISPEKLIPVMVKSIQELSTTVEKQKADLREVTDILMKKINELSEELRRLKSSASQLR